MSVFVCVIAHACTRDRERRVSGCLCVGVSERVRVSTAHAALLCAGANKGGR